ncbi:AraC family transcriptional regulator [Sphingomonas sp.]|uniref:AraC family transcriptional regulator n=1 Tax=Sphingomonas sp. TaxID=28214 RepID=UPI002CB70019|nr:AraC family transcriptional regulator [Sphingomonas sp.]HTG37277.1 AraC family transcriptional regulator [Sphingomonas sp.]
MTPDPLSEVLALLKPRSYITAGFDAGGTWALTLDDLAGRIKCYAVVRGGCWLQVDGVAPVRLAAGDCFVLPSGREARIGSALDAEPHRASEVLDPDRSGEVVTYKGGGDVFLVGSRFEVEGLTSGILLRSMPPLIRIQASEEQARLRLYIDLMMEELREARAGSVSVSQNLSHMILAQALRLYLANVPMGDAGWFAALADPRLGRVMAAIHGAPSRNWTLTGLARVAGMSRSGLAQHFASRVGEAPIAYLTRWRMMLAARRLTDGHETVEQVAVAVGYGSEQAFSTAFKRVMGCAPRQYARMGALV